MISSISSSFFYTYSSYSPDRASLRSTCSFSFSPKRLVGCIGKMVR